MKHLLASAAIAALLGTSPAHAWTDASGNWHQDIITSGGTGGTGGAGGAGIGYGGNAHQRQQQSQGQANSQSTVVTGAPLPSNTTGRYAVATVPDISAPSIEAGNLCAIGASGGGSWLGFGAVFGASWPQRDCEHRAVAAMAWNMKDYDTAVAELCQIDSYHKSMNAHGGTCPGDAAPVPQQSAWTATRPSEPQPVKSTYCNAPGKLVLAHNGQEYCE